MRAILHAWARADTERQELQDEVARLIAETVRLGELQVRSREFAILRGWADRPWDDK